LNYGKTKEVSIPSLREGPAFVTEDNMKASLLNEHFASQSTLDLTLEPVLPLVTRSTVHNVPLLHDLIVTQEQILNKRWSLNINKATGPDGIGNMILKNCASSLCVPLLILFNHSLQHGIFPTIWECANVVPFFKREIDRSKIITGLYISVKYFKTIGGFCV